ncbi:GNAT family N-acetyltransferase [Saccharothrix sp. S26]|uniref:GNAT family N-acetyltransferase n=1 Tax=Saccharothrix sp. S26 TaxID=2907215 RepID=UPI001F2CB13E|nr:GNAT family N-acetyltransferase [Saccharothrix sp. S26]MCE6994267.1 GNAT family N-acetyltransferase [Saccharothrix sp. S26]
MRVLPTPADVSAATADPIARWAAQALLPGRGGTAWAHGEGVAVLAPGLFRFDRLVLVGPTDDVAALLRAHVRPGVRPLVTAAVADELDWPVRGTFGWMQRTGVLDPAPGPRWLAEDEWDDVEALLRKANPDTWAWPREPGPSRWAGAHVDGVLVSVAADAWPAPEVGFVAGVATHPDHRGRSLSTAVCRFVASALLAERGTCGLMVDAANAAAVAVYRRLGFTYRAVTALRDSPHT